MTTVVIGGSRKIGRLSNVALKKIDEFMSKGYKIIIGDANGVDKQVQFYLHSKGYRNVEVFCVNGLCRNNIGNWNVRSISSKYKGFKAFSERDRKMVEEADIGFFIWDGKSKGTKANIYNMLSKGKPIWVYLKKKIYNHQEIPNVLRDKNLFEESFK